jgi:DNA-binding transcriptional LysR family regulator
MRLAHLGGIELFLAVARDLSFGTAAKRFGLTPSAVSSAVRKLEAHLGVALLMRTTRSVALTETGRQFYERAEASFESLEVAFEAARAQSGVPSGPLRINLPSVVFEPVIAPRLEAFVTRYPNVQLECVIDDEISDIVSQGFDAGVRAREQVASGMVAVRLYPKIRYVVAGAPSYFARAGVPQKPADLLGHRCLLMRFGRGRAYDGWEFASKTGDVKVSVEASFIANDAAAITHAAVAGAGLLYNAEHVVRRELDAGTLVECLPRHSAWSDGYFLYFPRHRQNEPKLRAFIDHFKLG